MFKTGGGLLFRGPFCIIASKKPVKVKHKADVGVSVEEDVAKWLDLQAETLINNDALELEKETAGTRPDTPVGQLTL